MRQSSSSDCMVPAPVLPDLPVPLTEYADRLLLSTGLHAEDALRIASGHQEPADELGGLSVALRTGWELTEVRPWASVSPFAHARSIRASSAAAGKSCTDVTPRDARGCRRCSAYTTPARGSAGRGCRGRRIARTRYRSTDRAHAPERRHRIG